MFNFKNRVSIRARLYWVAALAAMLMLLLGGSNLVGLQRNSQALSNIYERAVAPSTTLGLMRQELEALRFNMAAIMFDKVSFLDATTQLGKVKADLPRLWRQFKDAKNAELSPEEAKLVATVEAQMNALSPFYQLLETSYSTSDKTMTRSVLDDDWPPIEQKLLVPLTRLVSMQERLVRQTYGDSLVTARRQRNFVIGVLIFGLLLLPLIIAFVVRALEPAKEMQVVLAEFAKGNLTARASIRSADEMGKMADSLNHAALDLTKMLTEVGRNSQTVKHAAGEIAAAVETHAETTTQTSAAVAEITSTMEELSASSTQIADHSTSVVDIANQTWEDSKKGSEAMQALLDRMNDIRADNQDSLREIVGLGAKSKEISKVMAIINDVADQTKLIAFNAALEASSAGEAGKRFSVVAGEIRRLADSVTDSTGEIETKVQEIQNAITHLVVTSEKGAASIAAGMEASADTAKNLGGLVEAASNASSAARQISLSTQQQRTASGQVVAALREIVAAGAHTGRSIERISEISKEMAGMSTELDLLVRQFKLAASAEADATSS